MKVQKDKWYRCNQNDYINHFTKGTYYRCCCNNMLNNNEDVPVDITDMNIFDPDYIEEEDFVDNKDNKSPVKEQTEFDIVNKPKHYADFKVECIDAMEIALGRDVVMAFCLGNNFKYQWRAGNKDGNSKEQDLAKAEWYYNKFKELINK